MNIICQYQSRMMGSVWPQLSHHPFYPLIIQQMKCATMVNKIFTHNPRVYVHFFFVIVESSMSKHFDYSAYYTFAGTQSVCFQGQLLTLSLATSESMYLYRSREQDYRLFLTNARYQRSSMCIVFSRSEVPFVEYIEHLISDELYKQREEINN